MKTPSHACFKALAAVLFGCGLLDVDPARAVSIDFSKITCKQFFDAHKGDAMLLLAWLNGYYREENDPPIVDTEEFADEAKKLTAYCATHPQATMSTAADEIFAD